MKIEESRRFNGGGTGEDGKSGRKKRTVITVLAAILLLALYMLIFGFSAQDGERSGSLSQMISEKCVELLNNLSGGNWTEDFMRELADYFEHPLRKLAHFSEYACMGILLYILWSQWIRRGRKLYLLIVLWIFCSAGLDEFHQLFVPGRWGSFWDVLLDTCGGAFGMLLCIAAGRLVAGLRRRRAGHRGGKGQQGREAGHRGGKGQQGRETGRRGGLPQRRT